MRSAAVVLLGSMLLVLWPATARADGHSEFKEALQRLQGQTPVKARIAVQTWRKNGDGADAEEWSGQAAVNAEDGATGLRMHYARDLLARLEIEREAQEKNPKARPATATALGAIEYRDVQNALGAAPWLTRQLRRATFKSETAESWNGQAARKLTFELALGPLTERERKYIKKHEAALEVWIAADGTPLASKLRESVSGRAFIVVSFESRNEDEWAYTVIGDRLVATRHETRNISSGAGERGESKTVLTVQMNPG
jgi:hypothetical protein